MGPIHCKCQSSPNHLQSVAHDLKSKVLARRNLGTPRRREALRMGSQVFCLDVSAGMKTPRMQLHGPSDKSYQRHDIPGRQGALRRHSCRRLQGSSDLLMLTGGYWSGSRIIAGFCGPLADNVGVILSNSYIHIPLLVKICNSLEVKRAEGG